MTQAVDMDRFNAQGYVVLDVLAPDELKRFRAAGDALMRQPRYASEKKFHYVPLILPGGIEPTLLESVDHPVLVRAVETILGGGPLVLDNASFLAAEAGVAYHQGWHRDVLQVPEDKIVDEMFTPRWFHNNVQLNLALADDAAFWAVPGSHSRPDTAPERAAFGSSRHMSPVEAKMPGAVCLPLRAGQAALYNNNLIHRGDADFTTPRRTMHIGYHTLRRPPTWHFYNFDDRTFPPEHRSSFAPAARRWMEGRLARRLAWPDPEASYRAGFEL